MPIVETMTEKNDIHVTEKNISLIYIFVRWIPFLKQNMAAESNDSIWIAA